jgi:hypothetical protein
MAYYYVNQNAQPNGDHEVHKQDCRFLPENRTYLGDFDNCRDAVHEAKKHYSQVNGCRFCATECHTQ